MFWLTRSVAFRLIYLNLCITRVKTIYENDNLPYRDVDGRTETKLTFPSYSSIIGITKCHVKNLKLLFV